MREGQPRKAPRTRWDSDGPRIGARWLGRWSLELGPDSETARAVCWVPAFDEGTGRPRPLKQGY
jgi:hypothetical protein